jgi:hypothetical protein
VTPARLSDILARSPQSVDDVVGMMQAIDARLPDDDGVKWFNRLYLRVTLGVRSAVDGTTFRDAPFLAALDVVFANLYFSALRDGEVDRSRVPAAWRPLLDGRGSAGIARIQFALAGMNAHINRDLPEGIVQAFLMLGGNPITDRLRHQDFEAVNGILERVEQEARTDLSVGLTGVIDRLGGAADDAVAMWKVRAARAAAWTNAKVLWALRDVPLLRDEFFSRLDGLTSLAGKGLLQRTKLASGDAGISTP